MSERPRDSQRRKLYDAEWRIAPSRIILDKKEARRFFRHVTRALGCTELKMVFRRGGNRSYYQSWNTRICILNPTKESICHEIAHHVVYTRYGKRVPAHGREFAGIVSSMYVLFCEEDPTRVHREMMGLL